MSLYPSNVFRVENNAVLLILAFAVWGGICDLRYKKAGGLRPTVKDRMVFGIAALLCIGFLTVLEGIDSEATGDVNLLFVVILWGLWELGRWRVRRANPILTDTN